MYGTGEKGNPPTAGEALATTSATVHLSVLSAALQIHSDFFQLILYSWPADYVQMEISSAEEDSHEGCHTRNKDSFLFSICSLRS